MSESRRLLDAENEYSEDEESYEEEESEEEEEDDEDEDLELENDEESEGKQKSKEKRYDDESDEESDLISGTGSDESDEDINQEMLGDMNKLEEVGGGQSFYQGYVDGGLSPNEYSDTDDSIDQDHIQETFLVEQQRRVTTDYRLQEEHENALAIMKDRYKQRKAMRKKKRVHKVRSFLTKRFTNISRRLLSIDKFWTDLLFHLFTHMQIAGLIWAMPFTFPVSVYKLTQFTVSFNFDVISHREDDKINNLLGSLTSDANPSQYGLDNAPFYPWYLLPWMLVPPLLLTLWRLLPYARVVPFVRRFYYSLDRLLFVTLRILYIPFLIHVYAHGFCGGQGKAAFKCQFFCADKFGWCLTRSVPSIIAVVYYMIGFPLFYLLEATPLIVYRRNQKHLNYINNVEVEKALGISNNYVNYRYHMISSYSHFGCYYLIAKECFQKAVLVIIWASLDGRDYDGNYSWKSAIAICAFAFFVCILPLVIELYFRPYRTLSSTLITQILGWGHVINFMLAWFKALRVNSPFLLETQLRILMLTVNGFIIVTVLSVMTLMSCFRIRWPINSKVVHELETKYSHYLKAIHDGYMLYHHALTTNPAFVRCDLLSYHKKFLEKLHQEAQIERNPLDETIDDAILKLEEEYFANEALTIFPHAQLEECLPTLRAHMNRRQTEMILIPPQKRIMLLKILALRALIGDRVVSRKRPGEPDTESEMSEEDELAIDNISTGDKLNEFLRNIMEGVEDLTSEAPTEELAKDAKDQEIDRLLEEAASSEDEDSDDGIDLLAASFDDEEEEDNGADPESDEEESEEESDEEESEESEATASSDEEESDED